jgi:DNA-directed RNA polymerase specialized sigma24 family protein
MGSSDARRADDARPGGALRVVPDPSDGHLDRGRIGQLLGGWRQQELMLAARFWECQGFEATDIEDLYQHTSVVLLERRIESEAHLRNALRDGIKNRALHLRRDGRRHWEILEEFAPSEDALARAAAGEEGPERQLLEREDLQIVAEFLAELDEREYRVFLEATKNGTKTGHRRIALALRMDPGEVRSALRSAGQKHERWFLLYSAGRLCGYRSQTITRLKAGHETSEGLARGALVHLEGCSRCRDEHQVSARGLRRVFEEKVAAALLPLPATPAAAGWLAHLTATGRHLADRVWARIPGHRVLDGRIAVLYNSAPAARGARLAALAVLAGGAITATATHALTHEHHAVRHHQLASRLQAVSEVPPRAPVVALARSVAAPRTERRRARRAAPVRAPGRVVALPRAPAPGRYVPTSTPIVVHLKPPLRATQQEDQRGGGPFSP